jgi:hypothetical protein
VDCLIQIPVADFRGLASSDLGRRRRPAWPHGLVGVAPGSGEFLAGFGELRDTLPAETGNWAGRAQHVPAGRALVLENDFGRYFRRGMAAAGLLSPESSRELYARVRSRAYFGSALSPRSFLQLKIEITAGRTRLDDATLGALIDLVARLPVRIGRSPARRALAECGPPLARYLQQVTTRSGFTGKCPRWLVTPGRALCIVTLPHAPELTARQCQRVPLAGGADGHVHYGRRAGMDAWIVGGQPAAWGRRFELHLSRLHSERVVFENLAREIALQPRAAGPDPLLDREKVQHALLQCANYLSRRVAFGNGQRELVAALESDLIMHAAEWDALGDAIGQMRPTVRRSVESAFQIINGDVVLGSKGDTFENVTSSAIINRSAVQHALNNLGSDEDADLRGALAELARAVEPRNDWDASGLTESLIEECAGARRQEVIRALSERLAKAAPVAAEIERAGSAVRALPAGSGRSGS